MKTKSRHNTKKQKRKQEDREGQEQRRLKPGELLQVVGKKRKADNIVTEDAKQKQTKKINNPQPTPTTASKKRKMLSPMQWASYHHSEKSIQKNGDVIPPKMANGVVTTTTPSTARKTKTEIKLTPSRTISTTTTISDQMESTDSPDFLCSPMQSSQAKVGRYISLDCEMVGCGQPPPNERSQLARVSIVNFHGHVILDTFVRPLEPVTDWRTAISGVRPSDMATAIPFDSAREQVRELLRGRILVGHSVHNDLTVLGLNHPRRDIRDTAKFSVLREKYGCGRTPALRVLSLEILGLEIQKGEHSSTTDARVCMLIYKRFRTEFENEIVKLFGKAKPAIYPPPEPTLGLLIPIVKEKVNRRVSGQEVARGDYENGDGIGDMAEVDSSEHENGVGVGDDGQVRVGKIPGSRGKKKNKKKKKKGKYR